MYTLLLVLHEILFGEEGVRTLDAVYGAISKKSAIRLAVSMAHKVRSLVYGLANKILLLEEEAEGLKLTIGRLKADVEHYRKESLHYALELTLASANLKYAKEKLDDVGGKANAEIGRLIRAYHALYWQTLKTEMVKAKKASCWSVVTPEVLEATGFFAEGFAENYPECQTAGKQVMYIFHGAIDKDGMNLRIARDIYEDWLV